MKPKPHAGVVLATLPLEDRVALLLGRMLLRFNALEAMTGFTLGRIIGDDLSDSEIEAIVAVVPFAKLRQLTLAIAHEREMRKEAIETLQTVLSRAGKLEERRNSLVHSRYVYTHLPVNFLREKHKVTARGKLRVDHEFLSDCEKLEQLIQEINACADAINSWYLKHYLGVAPV
ncbi:MAG: hypothetical protein ACYC3F_16965 [Gemmatimonadaceae bacterium]